MKFITHPAAASNLPARRKIFYERMIAFPAAERSSLLEEELGHEKRRARKVLGRHMRVKRGVARAALLGGLVWALCAYAAAAAHTESSEVEEAAAAARAALARLPAGARLGEIGDERLRRAVQAAYGAVVELAENREPGRLAALNSKFERAYTSVEREAARGGHKTCAANCKALDGEPCLSKCRGGGKKFCGCKLIVFACVVAECVF